MTTAAMSVLPVPVGSTTRVLRRSACLTMSIWYFRVLRAAERPRVGRGAAGQRGVRGERGARVGVVLGVQPSRALPSPKPRAVHEQLVTCTRGPIPVARAC
eukprot:COSAG04_NODE_3012_length_3281_cov_1.938089_4_plen_101_part_00